MRRAIQHPASTAILVAWIASLGLLNSCGKEIHKKTLTPSEVGTVPMMKENQAEFSCWPGQCLWVEPWGPKCPINVDQNSKVQVGFDYHYDSGTAPCNCWWYRDCIFRGGVRFDLGAVKNKNIVSAQLKWKERGPCAARLFTATAPWSDPNSASEQITSPWAPNSQGPGEVEVGQDVRDWLEGKKVNRGWLFVGPDENFPNYVWVEKDPEISPNNIGTHKCTSAVSGFELVVHFTK
jgi:hypothetical protein